MATGFQAGTTGLLGGGGSASAVVTANTRVKTAGGYVGLVSDIVQFSGQAVMGNWVVPALRCTATGVPTIVQTSTGIAYGPVPPAPLAPLGPMTISAPDTRAQGT